MARVAHAMSRTRHRNQIPVISQPRTLPSILRTGLNGSSARPMQCGYGSLPARQHVVEITQREEGATTSGAQCPDVAQLGTPVRPRAVAGDSGRGVLQQPDAGMVLE